MFEVGDSFELRNQYGEHLHVIIAEASNHEEGEVMLVYLTSAKQFRDKTTIIRYGEHPFVTKKDEVSWIKYQNVMIYPRKKLQNLIVKNYGKIDDHLLEKIQSGIGKSNFVSKKIKEIFREWHQDRLFRNL